jgi:hypothetical protein
MGTVELEYEYKNFKSRKTFNVVKNDDECKILLSNTEVKHIEKKRLPIECCIDTGNNTPISWSRQIRSYRERVEFEKLLEELEDRGVIESSNSAWCNRLYLHVKGVVN